MSKDPSSDSESKPRVVKSAIERLADLREELAAARSDIPQAPQKKQKPLKRVDSVRSGQDSASDSLSRDTAQKAEKKTDQRPAASDWASRAFPPLAPVKPYKAAVSSDMRRADVVENEPHNSSQQSSNMSRQPKAMHSTKSVSQPRISHQDEPSDGDLLGAWEASLETSMKRPAVKPSKEAQEQSNIKPTFDDFLDADSSEENTVRYDSQQAVSHKDRHASTKTPLEYADTKPLAGFEWNIAKRYLMSRRSGFVRLNTLFSFLGILFGVATLIVVTAVMTGFRENLVNQVIGIDGHVNIAPRSGAFEQYDAMAKLIADLPSVEHVMPVISGQVLATAGEAYGGVKAIGIRATDLQKLVRGGSCSFSDESGSLTNFDVLPDTGQVGIAIGDSMARSFGLCVGDTIALTSPNLNGPVTPFSTEPLPRKRDYRIDYIFDTGYERYDENYVYMPLLESQFYFNRQEGVDMLSVTIDDPEKVEAQLPMLLASARPLAPGGDVAWQTWRARNGAFVAALDTERVMMFIVLTMILIVATLNIVSSMVMLVKEKTRNIAIMRTMGMTRGAVMRIFVIAGFAVGLTGTLCGVALGAVFCWNIDAIHSFTSAQLGIRFDPQIYGLARLPAVLKMSDIATTCAIALSLSFVGTLFPAWRAATLDPVEALRYE